MAGLKKYIKDSKDPIVKRALISLVADFDPFEAGSSYGNADPNIYTQQFIHADFFNITGGLANQIEKGADEIKSNKDKSSHYITDFVDNIADLKEGTYKWNEEKKEWNCTNCN